MTILYMPGGIHDTYGQAPSLHMSKDLSLPAEAVTQTFAILAKRGAGKTHTAAVLVEELLNAGLHVVVVDPVGDWWGLRASADGTHEGLPIVVLGVEHGDVPLDVAASGIIETLVVEEALSVVLDLSHFRKGEQTRFMTEFAERLYHKNREPLHLVLDEADVFAPQRPMRGQEHLLGAVEDLVRRGRVRGLGVMLVTQRAAVLNKDVLTQAEVLIALRTIAPQHRDAIDAWVLVHGTPGEREALMASLPSLPVGTVWFWSSGWLDVFRYVRVLWRETFDSSATPRVGASREEPRKLAAVDLQHLRQRLAGAITQASADDPHELRRRIAELEQTAKAQPVIERVEVPVLHQHQIETLEELVVSIQSVAEALSRALANARGQPAGPARATGTRILTLAAVPSPRSASRARSGHAPANCDFPLKAGERRMLQTLAQRYPTKLTRARLGTLAGFTSSGGTLAPTSGPSSATGSSRKPPMAMWK
jgi:hypothetical protein